MEINIPLPHDFSINTFLELKSYLKQLELCVHHAQKAVESAENSGFKLTEDAFVCFKHPLLANDVAEDLYEDLQKVELQINLS